MPEPTPPTVNAPDPPAALGRVAPLSPAAPSFAAGHRARLQEWRRIETAPDSRRTRRRYRPDERRQARQRLQQCIRRQVVACSEALHARGWTLADRGQVLHLSTRTLRQWHQDCRSGSDRPVGRPARWSPLPVRRAIVDFLKLAGPGIGVPTVQAQFPEAARAELADLLGRYRSVCRVRARPVARILHWQTPGRVWAADFTAPSRPGGAGLPPVAGVYPYVLAVRDLASGYMLAWLPVATMTDAATAAALAGLFAVSGAPLVLKTDNGSAFRAALVQQLLSDWGIMPLYSPPSCPGYNGAIEAAIGWLKKRTEQQARQHGHDGWWEIADLAMARCDANGAHPRRLNGRTPQAVWEARQPITAVERCAFTLTVERERLRARGEAGLEHQERLDHWRASAVDRIAIERALVEHDHLLFTRR